MSPAYQVLVHDGVDEVTVTFPDLPGCYATGADEAEAFENARMAAWEWMDRNALTPVWTPPAPRSRSQVMSDRAVVEALAGGARLEALTLHAA